MDNSLRLIYQTHTVKHYKNKWKASTISAGLNKTATISSKIKSCFVILCLRIQWMTLVIANTLHYP